MTVDRRDQVLMTFFSLVRFIDSTFSRSCVSTNGPFFSERLIPYSCQAITVATVLVEVEPRPGSLLGSPLHDEPIRILPTSRLVSLRGLSPWAYGMPAA